ncbi:MAG: hypothetical protein JXQ73_30475 [Phycisphaerae bacterium]|nr:hypothetical protein [Phycisphaerae bacterium]
MRLAKPQTPRVVLVGLILCLSYDSLLAAERSGKSWPVGEVHFRSCGDGDYAAYVPRGIRRPIRALVIVHGSIGEKETAINLAEKFIKRWTDVAEREGVVLVAPGFDRARFGGYRQLKGKQIGADEFVFRILEQLGGDLGGMDRRMYLYGHSAGGQCANRFVVTHPERVCAAVISAAGNYAYPNDAVRWPYGRKDSPNPQGFIEAATLPVTVVVGSKDVVPEGMGGKLQKGENRLERARHWVESMCELARKHSKRPRISLHIVDGVGHNSSKLTPACKESLFMGRGR